MSLARTARTPYASFILPAYNAGATLEATLAEVHAWLSARDETWELLLVDDGSRDGSAESMDRLLAAHPGDAIRLFRFRTNHGKGFAVRAALDRCVGSYAVFTDADLAYALENVPRVLDRLAAGAEAVIACRVDPESIYVIRPGFFSYLFSRHLMGRAFNAISRATVLPGVRDTQAGLKGFRCDAVKPLLPRLRLDGFSFDVELLRALRDTGARIDEVPVVFRYDREPTTVHFLSDALRMLRDIVRVRVRSMRGDYRRTGPSPRLIVHADDYGLAPGVDHAVEDALSSGVVTSASILVGGGDAGRALSWAASHSGFDFGVHLNLTLGRPVLARERVRSLVDRDGCFRPLGRLLLRVVTGRVRRDEVHAEWGAQLAAARAAGVGVTHLDSHQHVHLLPPLFGIASALADEAGAALRTMNGSLASHALRGDAKGIALALASRWVLRRSTTRRAVVHGTGTLLRERITFARLDASLRGAEPGSTIELVVHPGIPDAALEASGDAYRAGRARQRSFLGSEDFRSWIRLRGLRLTDFRA